METQRKVIPHPSDHELGYVVGDGEYSILLTDEQREQIRQYEEVGVDQPSVDQFVSEIASAELEARRAARRLESIKLGTKAVYETGSTIRESGQDETTRKIDRKEWGMFAFSPGTDVKAKEIPYFGGESDGVNDRKRIEMRYGTDVARVSYDQRRGTKEIALEGMFLSDDLRGGGKGAELLDFFMEGAKRKGLKLVGTRTVRKPMIAKRLGEAGFRENPADKKSEIHALLLGETRVASRSDELDEKDESVPVVFIHGDVATVERAISQARSKTGEVFYVVANDPADIVEGQKVSQSYKGMFDEKIEGINTQRDERAKSEALEKLQVTLGVRWIPPKRPKKR